MQRRLESLTKTEFDLAIIGGGIYGSTTAREAARRGLSVVLLEKDDFGSATSSNSQKIIHGGFRYLQSLDIGRMRESIRQRRAMLLTVGHLVQPLACVMPIYQGDLLRSKPVMAAALAMNDLIGWDRNAGISCANQRIPTGRMLSRADCERLVPGISDERLQGAALWYDAQAYDSERLTLSFVEDAARSGAEVANHVEVTGLLRKGNRVSGLSAVDRLSGNHFEISARLVLNAAGPWVGSFLKDGDSRSKQLCSHWLKATMLVLDVSMPQGVAVALPNPDKASNGAGLLFVTPWRGKTIVGTPYAPYTGAPGALSVTPKEVDSLLSTIKKLFPAWPLSRRHVLRTHVGLIPAVKKRQGGRLSARLHSIIIEHGHAGGLEGLISVVGVKYTTAGEIARKTIDRVCRRLGRARAAVGRDSESKHIGNGISVQQLVEQALRDELWGLSATVLRHLVMSYGTDYMHVLKLIRENLIWAEPVASNQPVIKAQIIYAIRKEMAQTLSDIVLRRIGLLPVGAHSQEILSVCAEIASSELGWDKTRMEQEISAVSEQMNRFRASIAERPSAPAGLRATGLESLMAASPVTR